MKPSNAWNRNRAAWVLAAAALAALEAAGCQGLDQARQQLTVLVAGFAGPESVETAQSLAKQLADRNLEDVFVVESSGMANVCVGHFDTWNNARAMETRARIRAIRDTDGNLPFGWARVAPIPESMPPSPWPLENADGAFTLHVASWEAPGRMAKAQAYAAELRQKGYEAYVYHGPRLSMVTIGAFGPEIFDNPRLVGAPQTRLGQQPPKPKVIDPKVNELIAKFPHIRLEGEDTWDGKHLPTQLVVVPGREPGVRVIPKALYRVSLWLVDTGTGLADERGHVEGVAQSPGEIPILVEGLVKQMSAALPAGRTVRIGVVGVGPTDSASAQERADAVVTSALVTALGRVAAGKATIVSLDETRQILDAAGKSPNEVLANPRAAKGVQGLDMVVIGTVTTFTTRTPPPATTPRAPGGFEVNQ